MILSVSRRTDIPAFYSDWFFKRITEGFVYVVNPYNRKQVSKISLAPDTVDCIVFWTKDPEPMLGRLDELKGYNYYFQFTITAYRQDVEKNIRQKKDIIRTFKELSRKIGKDRVIWRYDPVLVNDYYTKEYHYEWFEKLMGELSPYTERCVISFLDFYKKTERNIKHLKIRRLEDGDICEIASRFSKIERKYGVAMEACSESTDLTQYGIRHGSCIDKELISKILDKEIIVKKDDTQREVCGCVKSIDIGQYNTCIHHCSYCYANFDHEKAGVNFKNHDSSSPLLSGRLVGDEKITERKAEALKGRGKAAAIQEKFDI